jgi:hypothetical protein
MSLPRLCVGAVLLAVSACGAPRSYRPVATPLPTPPTLRDGRPVPCAAPLPDPVGNVATELIGSGLTTCARTSAGDFTCWGADGRKGLLDLCSGAHAASPVRIGLRGSQLALSEHGTCSIDEGVVSCTSAVFGMLRPERVPSANGAIDALRGARRIAIVNRGLCGLFEDEVRCVVNAGKTYSRSDLLGERFVVQDPNAEKTYALGIVPLPGATLLAGGMEWVCATDREGAPWCWGRDWFGSLGQGKNVHESNVPLRVGTLTDVRALETNGGTICAVIRTNRAFCWGSEADKLGTPDTVGVVALPFEDVRSVTVGEQLVCALVGESGAVRCLGKGTEMYGIGAKPTFSSRVEQLSSGGANLCARLVTGAVECLGMEGYLGNGAPLPAPLRNGSGIEATIRHEPINVLGPRP